MNPSANQSNSNNNNENENDSNSSSNSSNNNSNDNSNDSNNNTTIAGIVRGLFRGSIRQIPQMIGKVNLGSIPHNVSRPKVKTIAKSAAKISDMIDYHNIFQTVKASETSSNHNNDPTTQAKKTNISSKYFSSYRINRIKIFASRSIIELGTSSILGSTLFYVFDTSEFYLKSFYPITNHILSFQSNLNSTTSISSNSTENNYRRISNQTAFLSFLCGGMGGTAHGILTYSITKLTQFIRSYHKYQHILVPPSVPIPSLPGMILSHFAIHSILFGSYEYTKSYLCKPRLSTSSSSSSSSSQNKSSGMDKFLSRIEDEEDDILNHMIGFVVAGYIAGVSSEIISHYTSVFEELIVLDKIPHSETQQNRYSIVTSKINSYRNVYWNRFRNIGRPNVKAVLLASIPSALGFLTYEISKIISLD